AKDLALCITQSKGPREEIEAIGRFYYLEQSNAAEVAFVVREALRGRGLARRLLKEIIAIGRQRGLSKLTASVRADNKPMLRVFAKNGFVRMPVSDMQEVVLELALDEE
ncbi:MAG: GNAT family N-acetyltransferase, partial [Sedimenticolaceae bacterium]